MFCEKTFGDLVFLQGEKNYVLCILGKVWHADVWTQVARCNVRVETILKVTCYVRAVAISKIFF